MSEFNSFATDSRHKAGFDNDLCEFRIYLEPNVYATLKGVMDKNVIRLESTKVPSRLQGKGYGKLMMEAFLKEAEHQQWTIIPICSYVVHYLNRNEQWQHLRTS